MSRPSKYSKQLADKYIKAYIRNDCQTMTTCKEIGIHVNTIEDWIRLYKGFSQSIKEAEQHFVESIERNLYNMGDKNVVANIFILKNQWKEKYGEQSNLSIEVKPLWFDKEKKQPIIDVKSEDIAKVSEVDSSDK